MLEIKVTRAAQGKPHPDPDTLVFGKLFTDHMFLMDYHTSQGWHDPRIVPYGPLSLRDSRPTAPQRGRCSCSAPWRTPGG